MKANLDLWETLSDAMRREPGESLLEAAARQSQYRGPHGGIRSLDVG